MRMIGRPLVFPIVATFSARSKTAVTVSGFQRAVLYRLSPTEVIMPVITKIKDAAVPGFACTQARTQSHTLIHWRVHKHTFTLTKVHVRALSRSHYTHSTWHAQKMHAPAHTHSHTQRSTCKQYSGTVDCWLTRSVCLEETASDIQRQHVNHQLY